MQLYETFIDHSTHLGYLLAATGHAEISNITVLHTANQKVFMVGLVLMCAVQPSN